MKLINRIGETKLNKSGNLMTIVDYKSSRNIDVLFYNTGYIATNRAYKEFSNGILKDLYERTICGIGYLGEGENDIKSQTSWRHMIQRCYDHKYQEKHYTYIGCIVIDEWHNYQNFIKWYDKNYYEIENETMCLDKDILVKDNKIYSPETCVYVPRDINSLFTKTNVKRGKFPIGVTWHEKTGKYQAGCNNKGELIYLGLHNTPSEAFYAYKHYKEKLIKEIADYYKDKIPTKLYDALYRYEVSIND